MLSPLLDTSVFCLSLNFLILCPCFHYLCWLWGQRDSNWISESELSCTLIRQLLSWADPLAGNLRNVLLPDSSGCRFWSLAAELRSLAAGISWPWPLLTSPRSVCSSLGWGRGLRSLVVLGPHKVRETRQYQVSHWSSGADPSLVIGQMMGLCLVTTVSRVPRLLTRIYNPTKLWWSTQNERN